MLRRLYDWTMDLASRKNAVWALAAVAFVESSVFPLPPDILLIPMILAARNRAWRYAAICTIASVLGGMLGYAIGRIGCLLAGCCHGGLCPSPVRGTLLSLPHGDILSVQGAPFVALLFEPGVGVGSLRGQVLFPSQLLEIGTGLLLFGLLSLAWARWRRFDGQILAMLLVFYALARSFAEQFRGDAVRGLHALGPVTLSTSQLVSGGMVVLAAVLVALLARRGVAPEQPFVHPDPDAVLPEPRGPGGR